jgi:hypothetical protein
MLHEITRTQTHNRPRRAWALGLLAAALLLTGCESQADKDKKAADAAYREKLAKAQAIFAERCKTAGVVIKRTVKDVEGIELMKIRPKLEFGDKRYFDPMFEGAAMAAEHKGHDYIKQFLMYEYFAPNYPELRGDLGPLLQSRAGGAVPSRAGYAFVEYVDDKDRKRYRCKPRWSPERPNWVEGQHECEAVSKSEVRYVLDYEDLIDPKDREVWVAGTRLRVVDRTNGEVLAELTRYVFDPGFGVSTTGRWPWVHANTGPEQCPRTRDPTGGISRYFVDTVLQPKQGDQP